MRWRRKPKRQENREATRILWLHLRYWKHRGERQ
jgi:hypothetical protein